MKFFALVILFFSPTVFADLSPSSAVVEQALALKLDQDPQWLNLLNYRRDLLFWRRSQADSPDFFLAPNGRWNPRDELVATLEKIFDPRFQRPSPDFTLEERAQCIFPGRFLYLKRKLSGVNWPEVACTRFENFRDIIQAKSATYVFSSYYVNNPSSAFGHSFLRLNRSDKSRNETQYELIDFGVGFSAIPTTTNPILYNFMGLTGYFQGRFEANPYYYKVREYNDFENRDLWEYDLDLAQDEIDLLVAHVYELNVAGFDYLYFTENCSYRILAALDTVRPSLQLLSHMKIGLIPGDTVKFVNQAPGLVKDIQYRPSGRAIFLNRFETLSDDEKTELKRFSKNESVQNLISNKSPEEKQKLLDVAIDYIDFHYADEVLKTKGQFGLKKQVLIARSEVPLQSPPLEIRTPWEEAPHTAHGSAKLNTGYLTRDGVSYLTIGHRFVLHDLLDPVRGYLSTSEIKMGDLNLAWRLNRPQDFRVDDFTVVNIISMSPVDDFSIPKSWRLNIGWSRLYQDNCDHCLPLVVSGGIGLSKDLLPGLNGGLWLRGSAAYSYEFYGQTTIAGLGPAFLLRYYHTDKLSLLAEGWARYDSQAIKKEFHEASLGAQWNLGPDLGLRGSATTEREYRLELQYYY